MTKSKKIYSLTLYRKNFVDCFKSPWIYKGVTKCLQKRCLPNSMAKTQKRKGIGSIFQWRTDCWGNNLFLHPCSKHHDSGNTSSYNLQRQQPITSSIKATAAATTFIPASISRECGERKGDHLGHVTWKLDNVKIISVMW